VREVGDKTDKRKMPRKWDFLGTDLGIVDHHPVDTDVIVTTTRAYNY